MIALKTFENKSFGKITKGQTIPDRVLKGMDQRALKAAGFIGDEKKVVKEKPKKVTK